MHKSKDIDLLYVVGRQGEISNRKTYHLSMGNLDITPVERRQASGNCRRCANADRRWVVRKLRSASAIRGQALYPSIYYHKCSLCVRMGGTN